MRFPGHRPRLGEFSCPFRRPCQPCQPCQSLWRSVFFFPDPLWPSPPRGRNRPGCLKPFPLPVRTGRIRDPTIRIYVAKGISWKCFSTVSSISEELPLALRSLQTVFWPWAPWPAGCAGDGDSKTRPRAAAPLRSRPLPRGAPSPRAPGAWWGSIASCRQKSPPRGSRSTSP